jgi:hypothetical protein
MMHGEYKLARHASGVFHFADVVVGVLEHVGLNQVTDQTSQEPDWSNGEVNSSTYPDWIEAAREGVLRTLNHISTLEHRYFQAQVTRVRGADVDTFPDDVMTAATLAAWNAIFPELELPALKHESQWLVIFPASIQTS